MGTATYGERGIRRDGGGGGGGGGEGGVCFSVYSMISMIFVLFLISAHGILSFSFRSNIFLSIAL